MMIRTFKSCVYCLLLITLPCKAQIIDSFTDGDLKHNPSWIGDTSNFEVNAALQLHLNAPAVTGKSLLVTSSEVSTGAVWKFWTQLDFNPSSSNYAKVYLMSDKARIDSSLRGYYIRIGGTDDDISLFRQDGTASKLIIDGRNRILNASVNKVSVMVTRSFAGEWLLNCDSTGFTNYEELGSVRDTTYWTSRYFGVQCIYSSTRSNKFLFDNFEVTGKKSTDTIPPVVTSVSAVDDSLAVIKFSEEVDPVSVVADNFQLPSGFALQKFWFDDGKTVMLQFSSLIPCREKLGIDISGIQDRAGNTMNASAFSVTFCPGDAYDILITEIMADPDPPVLLPNVEYLELANRSGVKLNLEKWQLQVGSSKYYFPAIDLPADSFLIVCSSNGCSQFKSSSLCFEILSSSTLNNTGEYLGLRNKKGKLIHWINYDESFYRDDLKKAGGWSMEMVDLTQPCLGAENWKVSVDLQGGSPGKTNSVSGTVVDIKAFLYSHLHLTNDSTIRLYFTKPLNLAVLNKSTFALDQGFGAPADIAVDTLQNLYIDLVFSKQVLPGVTYKLDILQDITACTGQKVFGISQEFKKPEIPSPGDILINEILFDALPGSQEFVEFYNNSDKYISSADLKLAYRSPAAAYNSAFSIGTYPFLIPPRTFLIAAKSTDGFEQLYHIPDMRFVLPCFNIPTLSNTEGCVALMTKSLETLDELCYSDKMHFSMLVNKSGVSLERIRYNLPTSDQANWHSAAATDGFATPGAQNSQFLEEVNSEKEITLEYEIFSPDNDGYKDIETIHYQLDKPGFVANIIVFDAVGRRIRLLANNKPLGTSGSLVWDGIDDKGRLTQTGIYLIYIELHHQSGEVKRYKKTCVLGGKMRR